MAENQRKERVIVACYGYLYYCGFFCFVTFSSSAKEDKSLQKLLPAKAEYLQAADQSHMSFRVTQERINMPWLC